MHVLIAIITGLLTCLNYAWQVTLDSPVLQVVSLVLQLVLAIVTVIVLVSYQGRRTRPNYEIGKPRIFTLGFALIILSTVANVSVLAVFVLKALGVIQGL